MEHKLSITDLAIKDKRVLMRVDFNVPLNNRLEITDDTRISAAIHSIKYVLEKGGSLILMSHLGRPKGKINPSLSLLPCAKRLSKLIGVEVKMASDCIGNDVAKMAENLKPGEIMLLENLRFHGAEEHPDEDPSFAKKLASLGDLYVNDAFGTAHRRHASTSTITQFFPDKAAAGFLLEKEIKFLGEKVLKPKHPFYAIIGGAKISSKLGVLKALLDKVDALFIGGGMAYTFFKAQGIEIGDSLYEEDLIPQAKEIIRFAKEKHVKIHFPIDHVVVTEISESAVEKILSVSEGIPKGEMAVDIGPKTAGFFADELKNARTILWNGPLGVFEVSKFAKGTKAIAEAIIKTQAITIVGGGDSAAALQQLGYADRVTHISTGGGATLEYIEYGNLPGIDALSDT